MKVFVRILFSLASMLVASKGFSAQVVGVGSEKCIDTYSYGATNGTRIIQWACHGGSNQHWKLTAKGELWGHGGKCLDVAGAGTADGTPVQLWDCNGTANQRWARDRIGRLIDMNSGKCLDVPGGSTSDGAFLQIWTCLGGTNQKWEIY